MGAQPKNMLRIDCSMRRERSISRLLASELLTALGEKRPSVSTVYRDLAAGVGMVNESWITANLTLDENRSGTQRTILALSDALVDEVMAADQIVLAVPIYNYCIPAALKAWIDLVCRRDITFSLDEEKFERSGLLKNKSAFVIVTSGSTEAGSAGDFVTGYLRHVLGCMGITDVTVIDATGHVRDPDKVMNRARGKIREIAETFEASGLNAAE